LFEKHCSMHTAVRPGLFTCVCHWIMSRYNWLIHIALLQALRLLTGVGKSPYNVTVDYSNFVRTTSLISLRPHVCLLTVDRPVIDIKVTDHQDLLFPYCTLWVK
jgi:hypothetical protein